MKLAKAALSGPILSIIPTSALIIRDRFRRRAIMQDSGKTLITHLNEYRHLLFFWRRNFCLTRKDEVIFTKLRCRVPKLNFYMHRSGLAPSPLCSFCNKDETIEHYFLSCNRFNLLRKNILKAAFNRIRIDFITSNILSLGASSLGHCHRDVCSAVQKFLIESGRF